MKKAWRAGLNLSFFWVKTGVHFQELNSSVQTEFDKAVNWPINGSMGDCKIECTLPALHKKKQTKQLEQTNKLKSIHPVI